MNFVLNVAISAVVIGLVTWLANKVPQTAGFLMAIPLSTTIALAMTQLQYDDTVKTITLAKSIFVALMLTLVFFVPFLLIEKLKIGFWPAYASAIVLTGLTYPLHGVLYKLIFG